ncbi:MAG TPA: GIY-YIG nuclease family protein [Polyangiaceae bacterium]|nr:GIY-YIG nuclease family protein [Polyangiaceae bacterium]
MRALAELDVLIVDCQTTGASPAFGCVLELGWGLARANRGELVGAEAHWIALPAGQRVSRQVQRITGYEPAHAAHALPDSDAWARLRQAVQRSAAAPTAIHYARFELAFLRDWSARLEPQSPFPFDPVCVHAIATRLYPDLPRQSLRALAGYLGHSLDLARRSLGHVEATAFVWQRMCAELAVRNVVTWEQLQTWLGERAPAKDRSKKPRYPIASERYKGLPDAPGVYRFLRSNRDLLYVGKAASLKKRVASHFSGRASKLLAPEMLTQVGEIEFTLAPSALEAALLENDMIKTLRPPYNVQLALQHGVWYSTRDFTAVMPTRNAEYAVGPLASQYSLRPLAALIELSSGVPATPQLRSQAVGVSDLWTPDEAVFAAGWAELVARHPAAFALAAARPRHGALQLAKQLLCGAASQAVEEHESREKPEGWDPERVARHIERALAQSFRAYRRARFLQLLHDSEVVYREPNAVQARLLRIRDGALAESVELAPDSLPSQVAARAAESRSLDKLHFDRAKYDRLRVLTSELKRIARDGGEVAVHFGPRSSIPKRWLAGVLRLV